MAISDQQKKVFQRSLQQRVRRPSPDRPAAATKNELPETNQEPEDDYQLPELAEPPLPFSSATAGPVTGQASNVLPRSTAADNSAETADEKGAEPESQGQTKPPAKKSKSDKAAQAVENAGRAAEATGQGMQAAGKAAQVAGQGMQAAGKAAAAIPYAGPAIGPPIAAIGMGMQAAGQAAQTAGQEVANAGRQMQHTGQQLNDNIAKSQNAIKRLFNKTSKQGKAQAGQTSQLAATAAKKLSEETMLKVAFGALWTVMGFVPSFIFLHGYIFISTVVRKKIFGEMKMNQIIQFGMANALALLALLTLFVIIAVIVEFFESPWRLLWQSIGLGRSL